MKKHIESIDYLRAIMSVFVVIWHLGGAGKTGLYSPNFATHELAFQDVINFYVLLVAVPVFFFVSFYLFAMSPGSFRDLASRLKRFLYLYVFWVIVYLFWLKGAPGLQPFLNISSPTSFFFVVFTGGYTVYYFFASLFVLVFLAFAFHNSKNLILISGLALSTLSVVALPFVSESTGSIIYSAYCTPLNFLPYVFLGILFARNYELIMQHKTKLLVISVIGFFIAAFFEWNYSMNAVLLRGHGYALAPYMRSSLVFAVCVIAILFLGLSIKSNPVIRFMSKYSLALFCLHPFFLNYANRFIGERGLLDMLLATFITVSLSYICAIVLSRFLDKKVLF